VAKYITAVLAVGGPDGCVPPGELAPSALQCARIELASDVNRIAAVELRTIWLGDVGIINAALQIADWAFVQFLL